MSQFQEFIDKFMNRKSQPQVYAAEIVSVESPTCTIRIIESELEVPGVLLVADDFFGLCLKPKVGSRVLVGLVEGSIETLYVAQYSEIDEVRFICGKTEVIADSGGVGLQQNQASIFVLDGQINLLQGNTKIVLKDGKVGITNGSVSLKDLFGDLITLLNAFSVLTSVGPSAGLNPTTITQLTQLQTKVNSFLQ